jgi:serine/threonine protein phosphatase PrpC
VTESSAPPSATNGSDDPGPERPGAGPATPPSGTAVPDPGAGAGKTAPGQDPDPTGGVPVQSVGPAGTAGEHTDLRAVLEATRAEIEEADCPECGAGPEQASEGVCGNCGTRRPAVRDHAEFRLGPGAAVTDRGLRRRRNEDACALGRIATPTGEVLVGSVCDGVASARRGDEASLAAAEAAVAAVLTRVVAHGHDERGALDNLAAAAGSAAAEAAADLVRFGDPNDPPATTYTGAVTRAGSAVVSWVGDSRVYWLATDGTSQLLSTDDSWAEEIAAAGVMTREQAHADRRAHVLTRWLGHDSPEGPARARRFRPAGPGFLMLCSDGVWNHLPDADHLAGLLTGADVLADARALVDAALAEGGYDNATVALLPLDPADGDGEWGPRADGSDDTGPILIPLDGDDVADDRAGRDGPDTDDPTLPGRP